MRWIRPVSAPLWRQRNRLPSFAQKDAQRVGHPDFACLKSQVTKSRPGASALHQGWKCSSQWARRSGLLMAGIFCLCFFPIAGAQQAPTQPVTRLPATPPSAAPLLSRPGPQSNAAASGIPAAAPLRPPVLRFLVLLDPAHGGADTGALLDAATTEKSYTLALANQLYTALSSRGIRSIFTRDSDVALDSTARATVANRSHASACIVLHATSTGNGVHLFTSSLPTVAEADPRRAFLPWETAQGAYETSSLRLESDVDAALTQQHVPVLIARTSLMPLDSMACPAVAIEIAPLDTNTPLSDPGYQQKVVDALESALGAWRSDWRQQP